MYAGIVEDSKEGQEGQEEAEPEEEIKFTEDDDEFASAIQQHRGDPFKIFKLIEADGDGELSVRELKRAVERVLKVSITSEEASDMFYDADWDGGGSISATEFCLYLGMPSGGARSKLPQVCVVGIIRLGVC